MRNAESDLFLNYMVSVQDTSSVMAEQFRILYARLEQLQKSKGSRILCVTSAVKGEGKTFTAMNLAMTMGRDFGRKVLLMDADCKSVTLQKLGGCEDHAPPGWADVVLGGSGFNKALIPFNHENLFLLPAGKIQHPSSSLISSLAASNLLEDLKKEFDSIVMDAPPILPLADMRLLEDLVDGIILVIRAEETTRDVVAKALTCLQRERILGLVLNGVKRDVRRYYHYDSRGAFRGGQGGKII